MIWDLILSFGINFFFNAPVANIEQPKPVISHETYVTVPNGLKSEDELKMDKQLEYQEMDARNKAYRKMLDQWTKESETSNPMAAMYIYHPVK